MQLPATGAGQVTTPVDQNLLKSGKIQIGAIRWPAMENDIRASAE
jgi:hypothetical protein